MNSESRKKEAMNYVQSIFYPAVNDLISDFKLPEQKFIKQIVFGIIKSRSVIGQRIAKSLEENIKLCKTCDRLYRNLKKTYLHSILMFEHMKKTAVNIEEDTPIFIDLSDINKSGSCRMEGLDKVWDGSESKSNLGYFTFQATFCAPENPRKISLYYSDLFGLEKEIVSENEKILEFIHQSMICTGNKGIYVGDKGFDRGQLITDMIENDGSFIFCGDKRHLLFKEKMQSYHDIAIETKLIYEVKSKKRIYKANIVEVGYKLPNPPQRKHKRKRVAKLYLVIAKEKDKGYVYYLCRFRKEYSAEKTVQMAIQYYGMRWSIEEVHQQIKQDFGWEKIQFLHYESLKNMNALLWIAAGFIYNEVRKIALYLIKKIPGRMVYKNFKKEFSKNMYYKLTDTVSHLFELFRLKPKKKYKGRWKKYYLINQQFVLRLED